MHPLIRQYQPAIAELCRRYGVRRLDVFGSAARSSDFVPDSSDADFLVEFSPATNHPSLKVFFSFQKDLGEILGRPVDLAETSALRNPYIKASINQNREIVYAA